MDKPEEISEEDLKRLKEAAEESLKRPWVGTTVHNRVPVFPDELLALITEIERLRAENALLKIVSDGYDECAQELRETALENNRLAAASSASAAKQQTISEILQRVEEQQVRIEHAYRHAIAERDRLAALVECATGFDLEEGDTRISFQSNGWTVETEDDDRVRMLSVETQWEEYGSGEWMNSHFLFPTREAAFSAFEAVRAKEAAE